MFCLAEGPNRQAVEDVHREAHGLLASTIIEVEPGPVSAFFGEVPARSVGESYTASAVRAVLFTDMCDSTALTHAIGDEASTAVLDEHDAIVRLALGDHGGREVKHTGDGIMASFNSVASAVESAIQAHRAVAERNRRAEVPFDLRVGISAGEPVTKEGDLFGAAVQLAARLCDSSDPGQITVSVAVRELCIGKRLQFGEGRSITLKGFPEPTHCYDVLWS